MNSGGKMGNGSPGFRRAMQFIRKDQALAVVMVLVPAVILTSLRFSELGMQFPLFRLEWTSSQFSFIPITQDLNFVTFWLILWVFGACTLLSGIILSFLEQENIQRGFKRTGILIALSGIFFLLSVMLQYNFIFYSQEILVIPAGVPLMILVGVWITRDAKNQSPAMDQADEKPDENCNT